LPATGIAETETWNALAGCYLRHAPSVLPPEPLRIVLQPGQTIAPGERNLHVYLVQAMLQALGQCYANASPPAVTGVLDASTQRAVRSLQALFGHEQTGVIDHRFWAYLRGFTRSPSATARLLPLPMQRSLQQISAEAFGFVGSAPAEGARKFCWDGLWPELLPVFPGRGT
ncbi:MAG: peptidoglycan-binding domain-containing protein, partial [Oscillospiraceae bacterium]